MNIMKKQIRNLFNNPQETLQQGLWFNGYEREGEFKAWNNNRKLEVYCFYKNGNRDGEYKQWNNNGELWIHYLYKDGKVVKDYLK